MVPPIVHETLSSAGTPLDGTTRTFFERRFGHDFGRVRVHADTRAAGSSDAVNALAYTVGTDIVFGAGQYAPGTGAGDWLLAHELAHVDQQTGGGALALQRLSEDQTPEDWKYVSNYRRVEPANYERRVAGVASERAALESEAESSAEPTPVLRDLVRLTALDLMIEYRSQMIAGRDSLRDPAGAAVATSTTRDAAKKILALDKQRRDLERSLFALGGLTQSVSPFTDAWASTIEKETSEYVNDDIKTALETYANREAEAFAESKESIGWNLVTDLTRARTQQILRTTDQINAIYKEVPYLTQFYLRDPLAEEAESFVGDPTGDLVAGAKSALGLTASFVELADLSGMLASARRYTTDVVQAGVSELAGPTLQDFADNTFGSSAAYADELRDAYNQLIENINKAIGLIGSETIDPFRLPLAVKVTGERLPALKKQLKELSERAELMLLAKTLGLTVLEAAVALLPVVGPALAFATNLYSSASDFQRTVDERNLGKAAPSPAGTLDKQTPSSGEVVGSGAGFALSVAGAAGLSHGSHVEAPDLDVSPVRLRPEPSADIIETGPSTPRSAGQTLVPESTPRPTGPTIVPESTPRPTGPTIVPESTPRPTGPTIVPESMPRTTGPTIAPESTPRPTGPTIAPEGTGGGTTGPPASGGGGRRRRTGPTLVPESTGPTLVPEGGGGGTTGPPPSDGGRRRRRAGPTLVPESAGQTLVPESTPRTTGPTLAPESIEPTPRPRTRRRTVPTQIPESIGTSSMPPTTGPTAESVRAGGTLEPVASGEVSGAQPGGRTLQPSAGDESTPVSSDHERTPVSSGGSGNTAVMERPAEAGELLFSGSAREFVEQELGSIPNAPYLADFETAPLGRKLGEGSYKNVYRMAERDDLAIGILKDPSGWRGLLQEINSLNELAELGFPVAEVVGLTVHEGSPAIVMKRYAGGGSRPIVFGNASTKVLNARSVRDLQAIRRRMIDEGIVVADLQFLIGAEGEIYINDPIRVMTGGPEGTLAAEELLNKALEQLLRQEMNAGETLLAAEIRQRIPVTVDDDVWTGFLDKTSKGPKRIFDPDPAAGTYTLRRPRRTAR